MAESTLVPTQNPADTEQEKTNQERNAGGSKPNTNKIFIGKYFFAAGKPDNIVNFIQVDNGPKLESGWEIHNGSLVEINGTGLGIYNQIALWFGGSRQLIEGQDVRKKSDGSGLEFTVRIPKNFYADGSAIQVEFLQHNRPDNDRTLEKNFYYLAKTDDADSARKAKQAQEAAEKAQVQGGAARIGPTGLILDAAGTVLGGVVTPLLPNAVLVDSSRKNLQQALQLHDKQKILKAIAEAKVLGDVEGLKQALKFATNREDIAAINAAMGESRPQPARPQAPSAQSTVQPTTRQEEDFDTDAEHQGGVEISGTIGGSQTLKTEATGAANATQTATVSSSAAGSATVSATSAGQTVSQQQTTVSGGAQGQVKSTTQVSGSSSASTQTSATAKANLSQSMKVVGEHLGNHPEAAANIKANVKQEIITALASGKPEDLENLSPEAKVGLQSVLRILGAQPGLPPQLGNAVGNIRAELEARAMAKVQPLGEKGQAPPSRPESPGQQKSTQPTASSVTSQPGKGKVDAVESTSRQSVQQPPASAPHARPSSTQKSPTIPVEARGNLDSAGAKQPVGMQGILKNRLNLESRLSQRQPGSDKTLTASGRITVNAGAESELDITENQQDELTEKITETDGSSLGQSPGKAAEDFEREQGTPQTLKPGSLPGDEDEDQDSEQGQGKQPEQADESGEPNEAEPDEALPEAGEAGEPAAAAEEEAGLAGTEAAGAGAAEGAAAAGAAAAVPLVAAALVVESKFSPRTKWWIALISAYGSIFTFFGFYGGWIAMVRYWRQGNKFGPEKSLPAWQKVVTVISFFAPLLFWAGFIFLVMVVGCNYPVPKSTFVPTYRGSVLGALIGDQCKYFDISNLTSAAGGTPSAAFQSQSAPITPRGN